MWFSGLRGAVAFALGVTFLEHPGFGSAIKGLIFGTTVMVIVSTVIVFGGLTPYMLRWLSIAGGDEGHEAVATSHDALDAPPEEEQYVITAEDLEQPVFGWLYRIDATYIRPWVCHQDENEIRLNQVILERESRISRGSSDRNNSYAMSPLKPKATSPTIENQGLLKSAPADDVQLEGVSLDE